MEYTDAVNHWVKLKENEKSDKYLDITSKLKKQTKNKKQTMEHDGIPFVISAPRMISKGWVKRLKDMEITGQMETIQIIELLKSLRILRRVLETWRDLLLLKL